MKRLIWIVTFCLCPWAAEASAADLPLSVPFQFENNQIFLKAGIGKSKPLWFILDSGASGCVVDTAIAKRLGIKTEGSREGTGAGKGTYKITFANNVVYRLPGIDLAVPQSYVIDLSGQRTLLGRDVAGILGYDFFARYVVRLDFAASIMTLTDPQTAADGPGTFIPITLIKKTPYIAIRAKVTGRDPVETQVLVDSGSGDAVDVDELAHSPLRLEVIGGVGLGREFRTVVGRAEWAEIGPFRLTAPLGATGGTGLIGLDVLRRFDVVFDYAHAHLILSPNRFFAEPFLSDASGLDLRCTDDLKNFVVHDVAAGSAAAEAGLKPGDIIVSLDNQPAKNFTIGQVQTLLMNEGRIVELQFRRGSAAQSIALHLKKRI